MAAAQSKPLVAVGGNHQELLSQQHLIAMESCCMSSPNPSHSEAVRLAERHCHPQLVNSSLYFPLHRVSTMWRSLLALHPCSHGQEDLPCQHVWCFILATGVNTVPVWIEKKVRCPHQAFNQNKISHYTDEMFRKVCIRISGLESQFLPLLFTRFRSFYPGKQ